MSGCLGFGFPPPNIPPSIPGFFSSFCGFNHCFESVLLINVLIACNNPPLKDLLALRIAKASFLNL
jgi:hypothetical protein